MKRNTVTAWIGVFALVGTGIGVLVRAQTGASAARASGAIVRVDRDASEVTPRVAAPLTEEKPDAEQASTDRDGHLRQTALDSDVGEGVSFPPLPSRVMPGPVPRPTQVGPEQRAGLSPSPPAPSKTLPEIRP